MKILLTGGSCAGKTEILPILEKSIKKNGFTVKVFDETATELLNSGVDPQQKNFQEKIFIRQLEKENEARNENKLYDYVIFDRGFLDQRAYTSPLEFEKLIKKYNVDIDYDLVIHLESNAKNRHVTAGRLESQEEAIKLEEVTKFFTSQHHNFKFVRAQDSIEEKINEVCKIVFDTFPDILLWDNQI